MIWQCDCDCGGTREVPAQYFTSGRIKKCEACVHPKRTELPELMNRRREEIEMIRKAEEDVGWYPEPFRCNWRKDLDSFKNVEVRQLLFETIMDGKDRTPLNMIQATDIVNRVPLLEMDIEFGTFSPNRIRRAIKTLGDVSEETRSIAFALAKLERSSTDSIWKRMDLMHGEEIVSQVSHDYK